MKSFLNELLRLGWQGSKKADPWDHSQCQGSFLKIANQEAPELDTESESPKHFFLGALKKACLCV